MRNFDLCVAYRVYPGICKPVFMFQNNKLKLAQFAFKSFVNALGKVKTKLYIILDTCPNEYKDTFLRIYPDAEIIEGVHLGNPGSFEMQMNLLLEQNFSDLVYFAEDDYFYLPDSIEISLDFYRKHKPHFLTLYYHPDYLNWEIHNISAPKGIAFENRFWQRIGSTTLTFLTSKKILDETKNVFLSFKKKNYDCSLWFSLTKTNIFKPAFYKLAFNPKRNWFYAKMIAKMWWFNAWQSLFGNEYSLYAPFPSLATHLERDSLAPNVRWNELFQYYQKLWKIE